MKQIVKICKKHGELTIDQVKIEPNYNCKSGFMYRCTQCRIEKNKNAKWKYQETKKRCQIEYGIKNRQKLNEWARQDRKNNPEKYRDLRKKRRLKENSKVLNNEMLKKYGITVEDYTRMLNEQGGVCKICRKPEIRRSKTPNEITLLSIDHCHITNVVRGLLCNKCNQKVRSEEYDRIIRGDVKKYLDNFIKSTKDDPTLETI